MEINMQEQLNLANEAAKRDFENPNYYGTCTEKDSLKNPDLSERPLHLFTASAGSGKTWRLAFEYICLLLKDAYIPAEGKPSSVCVYDNYRHILAITFTNKATAEMKDRILANLELILNNNLTDEKAKNERETYLQQLAARLNISTDVVVKRAGLVYDNLLHDYSHFHIQTIDSFFQSVLRNLAQELGIGSYWEVELDSDAVLKEASHRLLNKVRDDEKLQHWVTEYVKERIDDNKNWNIEGELVSFGLNLFSEALITNDKMDQFLKDDPNGKSLRDRITEIKRVVASARKTSKEKMVEGANKAIDFCESSGMLSEHFSRGTIYNYLVELSNGNAKDDTATLTKFLTAETPDEMAKIAFSKDFRVQHMPNVAELQNKVAEAKGCFEEEYGKVTVFNQVLKNINQIGLLADIKAEVAGLQEEQNIFMLAYAQPLLHKFISNDDAPFVFERIGESLRFMMIDEFQDTSRVQYQNFRPLIQNCCSEYSGSLIVGDAKQAIYRFRNGDWRLIESLRKQSEGRAESDPDLYMSTQVHYHDMQFNFRSSPNVVNFNNSIFRANFSDENASLYPIPFKRSIVSLLDEASGNHTKHLKDIYSNSHQFAKKSEGGYVKVKFHQKVKEDKDALDDNEPWTHKALLAEIKQLKKDGVEYADMTILSRFNKDIPKIADYLTKHGVPVVSDLAFLLRASIKVRLVIDALRYVEAYVSKTTKHPKDELYKKQLSCDYLRYSHLSDKGFNGFEDAVPEVENWCSILRGESDLNGKPIDKAENADEIDILPSLPIYDMAEEIYHLLFPNIPTDEYVQAFFDYLRDFLTRHVASIRDVLNYWDEKLSSVSIPADPKKANGVKMMSIHKSKGLESHTILLANCSWKVTTDRLSSFWCSGVGKLGEECVLDEDIPMLPIDFTSNLENTTFENEYWDEMAQLHAENVNLFYVALTRARHNLVVIDEYSIPKNDDGDDNTKYLSASMGRLLHDVFDADDLVKDVVSLLSEDNGESSEESQTADMCYSLGEIVPSVKDNSDQVHTETVTGCDTFPIRGRFRQSGAANSFILNKSIATSADVDFGIQMHSLLSYISSFNQFDNLNPEIHKAVDRLKLEGVLNREQTVDFEKQALTYFSQLDGAYLKEWFSPQLKVYNEDSIILYSEWTSKKLEEKRPDRLVYDENTNTFTIVDYKTGHYSAALLKKHSEQVRTYMNLALQLRPGAKVRGYVWYLTANKVEKVEQ